MFSTPDSLGGLYAPSEGPPVPGTALAEELDKQLLVQLRDGRKILGGAHTHACACLCKHMHACARKLVHTHIHTHRRTHARTNACTTARTHAHRT